MDSKQKTLCIVIGSIAAFLIVLTISIAAYNIEYIRVVKPQVVPALVWPGQLRGN